MSWQADLSCTGYAGSKSLILANKLFRQKMASTNPESFGEAIKNDLPFTVFRLPGEEKFTVLIQQNKNLELIPYKQIDSLTGFVIAPFRGKKINHLYCLSPDVCFRQKQEDNEILQLLNNLKLSNENGTSGYTMTKKEYLDRAAYLVDVLKSGELRKVVLSRVSEQSLVDDFDIGQYFSRLMNKHPKAFVYLVNLPGYGVWIGATPEVLLTMEEDHAQTVALAGTQAADSFKWTEKEIKEQRIVMDYIEELLHKHEINEYGRTGPFTVKAGNLVHLKTIYNLSIEQIENKVGELIAGLHPTPAVCGLPRKKAYGLIRKVEKHQRSFYSGFLGPWNLLSASKLYVNLRCAQLSKNKLSLYVGGGFTSESNPLAEWEETVRKSETLLSVLEKS